MAYNTLESSVVIYISILSSLSFPRCLFLKEEELGARWSRDQGEENELSLRAVASTVFSISLVIFNLALLSPISLCFLQSHFDSSPPPPPPPPPAFALVSVSKWRRWGMRMRLSAEVGEVDDAARERRGGEAVTCGSRFDFELNSG